MSAVVRQWLYLLTFPLIHQLQQQIYPNSCLQQLLLLFWLLTLIAPKRIHFTCQLLSIWPQQPRSTRSSNPNYNILMSADLAIHISEVLSVVHSKSKLQDMTARVKFGSLRKESRRRSPVAATSDTPASLADPSDSITEPLSQSCPP